MCDTCNIGCIGSATSIHAIGQCGGSCAHSCNTLCHGSCGDACDKCAYRVEAFVIGAGASAVISAATIGLQAIL